VQRISRRLEIKKITCSIDEARKIAKLGIADEVEYDGENVDEVLMVTPSTKQTTKKVAEDY
jgi:hypothetical protein